jgi:hypothetical protein
MSGVINCDTHGDQLATYVCAHIVKTVHDKKARGFAWCVADDGDYYADCDECNAMPTEEWKARVDENLNVICFGCFETAAKVNGVEIDKRPGRTLQ